MPKEWRGINDLYFHSSKDKDETKHEAVSIEEDSAQNENGEPEVRLSEGTFIQCENGFQFNNKCTVQVKVEYLKETPRKKVTFKLFSIYNGEIEDMGNQAEGFEENGYATAELTLFYNEAYHKDMQNNPDSTVKYYFTASHSKGEKEIESERFVMPKDQQSLQIEISNIILPNENNSFTTMHEENEIHLTAAITPTELAESYNDNIEWEIEDDPDKEGVSPIPDISELRGNEVNILINIPNSPNGRNYNILNYRVRAKITVDGENIYSEWKTFRQDEIDMLRQQYIDMSKNSVPDRDEFINSGGTEHFPLSEGACKCGHHSYNIWKIIDHLENIRDALGHRMIVNSGYRCPVHNASINGATNSRHIYGDAADIQVEDFNSDGAADENDWNLLEGYAQDEIDSSGAAGYIEPYEQTGSWVHMDWRP